MTASDTTGEPLLTDTQKQQAEELSRLVRGWSGPDFCIAVGFVLGATLDGKPSQFVCEGASIIHDTAHTVQMALALNRHAAAPASRSTH